MAILKHKNGNFLFHEPKGQNFFKENEQCEFRGVSR